MQKSERTPSDEVLCAESPVISWITLKVAFLKI